MTKKEFKPFEWNVMNYDCNRNVIKEYNILAHKEDTIKKMRKQHKTKEEFSDNLKRELKWQYWSRSEYELILIKTEDNCIVLTPWCGCRNPDEVKINVTDNTDFDWVGFADKHIERQIYKNSAKIDVWDQISWRYDEFLDYVWNYRFKYERKRIGE